MSENVIFSTLKSNGGKGNYASVNGVRMYYETFGAPHKGTRPLILLHGGLGTIDMFAQFTPQFSQDRQVIAAELQAHGHTADIDRPLSFESMADDVAAMIEQLNLGKADLLGYSLGGEVAQQTAIRHPEVIGKLIVISAACKRNGWYPATLQGMAAMTAEAAQGMVGSPMHAAYVSAAPRPQDWPVLVDKTGQLLRKDYDWSKDLAALKIPVLIIVGDADAVRTAHAVEMYSLLGGGQAEAGWDGSGMPNSQLAILPGVTHYTMLFSPLMAPIIKPFLDASIPNAK